MSAVAYIEQPVEVAETKRQHHTNNFVTHTVQYVVVEPVGGQPLLPILGDPILPRPLQQSLQLIDAVLQPSQRNLLQVRLLVVDAQTHTHCVKSDERQRNASSRATTRQGRCIVLYMESLLDLFTPRVPDDQQVQEHNALVTSMQNRPDVPEIFNHLLAWAGQHPTAR
jgi:hypothetical protein